jgi:Domain of unknown function (DUF4189)
MFRLLAVAALIVIFAGATVVHAQPPNAQAPGKGPSAPSGEPIGPGGTAPGSGPSGPGAPGAPGPSSPGAPGPSSEVWGAIAFTADGSYATNWRQPSKPEAEADVSKRCARMGRGGCEVVSFPGTLCAALANYRVGRYRGAFTAGGNTNPEAQRNAIDRCNNEPRSRGRCSLRTVVCGDGR